MPKPDSKLVSPTALAVIDPKKPVDLEKLPSKYETGFVFDAKAHGERALAMIRHVDGLKKERAVKAILAGIYLQQVKAALGHGDFNSWCTKHLGKSKRAGEYYMSLAAKFARSSKLLMPEIVGANQLTLDLSNVKDDAGKAVLAKLEKFVGERGLTELMELHEVIKRGGARSAPVAPPSPEERRAAWLAEAESCAKSFGSALHELGDRWMTLDDDQLRLQQREAEALAARIAKYLDTPKPKRAAFNLDKYVSEQESPAS